MGQKNNDLVRRAQGLLPDIHDMELATGRGSHGTAALRSMMFSCKSIYIDIGDSNGNISMAKCLERQPSLKAPLEHGVIVKVVPGELELAVPGLFQLLSRTGNVSNSSYRLQTTLQSCWRLHQLAVQYGRDADPWDKIETQATMGMAPEDARNVSKLRTFVTYWSGGEEGDVLRDLQNYEQTLTVHRKIKPDDLETLGKMTVPEARIVPAPWII